MLLIAEPSITACLVADILTENSGKEEKVVHFQPFRI